MGILVSNLTIFTMVVKIRHVSIDKNRVRHFCNFPKLHGFHFFLQDEYMQFIAVYIFHFKLRKLMALKKNMYTEERNRCGCYLGPESSIASTTRDDSSMKSEYL